MVNEKLYWYKHKNNFRPSNFIYQVGFQYVGLLEPEEESVIEKYNLRYVGNMTRNALEDILGTNYYKKSN